jgi:hypothetical protein
LLESALALALAFFAVRRMHTGIAWDIRRGAY